MSKKLYKTFDSNVPLNYERFFVPSIAEPLAGDLLNLAEIKPGEKVLDVACGTGIVAWSVFDKVGSHGSVAGLDPNTGMLALARELPENNQEIERCEASAEAMPFPDNKFDIIFCQLGLQFFEDKVVAFNEIFRVLKAGGRLVFNVPGAEQKVFTILAKAVEENINPQAAQFVSHVFSLHDTQRIRTILHKAGFDDPNIKEYIKEFDVPAAREFLWQYLYSTPMAEFIMQADEKSLMALVWSGFLRSPRCWPGTLVLRRPVAHILRAARHLLLRNT